jgi:Ca2+-binding RTX toxin-like protein
VYPTDRLRWRDDPPEFSAGTDFVTSENASTADLGSAHFAYNASSGELFYDSNGGDASGASRILLAVFDNHAALSATDIHKI